MTPTDSQTRDTIQKSVREYLLQYAHDHPLKDDDDIFELGLVNSLVALDIITFVEKSFAITVGSDDLEVANFASISAITALVEKLSAPSTT